MIMCGSRGKIRAATQIRFISINWMHFFSLLAFSWLLLI